MKTENVPKLRFDEQLLRFYELPVLYSRTMAKGSPHDSRVREMEFVEQLMDGAVAVCQMSQVRFNLFLVKAPKIGTSESGSLEHIGCVEAKRRIILPDSLERVLLADVVLRDRDAFFKLKNSKAVLFQVRVDDKQHLIESFIVVVQ